MNATAPSLLEVLEIGTISTIISGVFWNTVAVGAGLGARSDLLGVAATAALVTVLLLYVELA